MKKVLLLCFLFAYSLGIAQNRNMDSIQSETYRSGSDSAKIKYLLNLSNKTATLNPEESRCYLREVISIAEKNDRPKDLAKAYLNFGNTFIHHGKFDSALYYYKQGRELLPPRKWLELRIQFNNNIGIICLHTGGYDEAISLYQNNLEIADSVANFDYYSAFHNLGAVHERLGNNQEALRYFQLAGKYLNKSQRLERANVSMNIGVVHMEMSHLDSAAIFFDRALVIANEGTPLARLICMAENNLATLNLIQGENVKAISHVQRALEAAKEYGFDDIEMKALSILGDAEFERKNYRKAIAHYEQGLILANRFNDREMQLEHNANLTRLFRITNQPRKGFYTAIRQLDLRDSVFIAEKKLLAHQLEKKYQSEKKDLEIANLEESNRQGQLLAAEEQKATQFFTLLAFTCGLLLMVVIGAYLILRRNRDTIVAKNRIIEKTLLEKEMLMKEIHHRVKNNLQNVSSLLRLQSRYISDESALTAVGQAQDRVNSMALIHQKLYQQEDITVVNLREYVEDLCSSLTHAYKIQQNLETDLQVSDVNIDVDSLIPIGLILNELISNAFKHGLDHDNPQICISVEAGKELILEVSDNGKGIPDGLNLDEVNSFGMKMIQTLARKFEGDFFIKSRIPATFHLILKDWNHV